MITDLYVIYQFLKRLTTPFEEWEAFQYGIIDKEGTILRKRSQLNKVVERESFTVLDTLVLKIKRLLNKIPGGNTRLGTYAAALWLIKESETHSTLDELVEDANFENLTYVYEEVAANNVGSGNIAGAGVGPNGEPPVFNKSSKKVLKRFKDVIK